MKAKKYNAKEDVAKLTLVSKNSWDRTDSDLTGPTKQESKTSKSRVQKEYFLKWNLNERSLSW